MNIGDMSLYEVMRSLWLDYVFWHDNKCYVNIHDKPCMCCHGLWWFSSNCYEFCFDFMHVCDYLIRVLVIKLLRLVKLLKSN